MCIWFWQRILAKLAPVIMKIWYSPGFMGHCLLWLGTSTFWPQNLISITTNWNTSVTKTGWNSLHWFLRYGVHKVFGTHRLTDGHTRKPNAYRTKGFWRQRHRKSALPGLSGTINSYAEYKQSIGSGRFSLREQHIHPQVGLAQLPGYSYLLLPGHSCNYLTVTKSTEYFVYGW